MRASFPRLVASRYRLEQRIAGGGMGEVWRAADEVLGRQVAVKLLHGELAEIDGFRARFRAEAQAAARLAHTGVVSVFDYGDDDDGTPFLVMELVRGEPLSARLARDGALPTAEAMSILAQAASVLDAALRQGIVHRDVKPANLLLREDGRVKVTDFGIARGGDPSTPADTGNVLGTSAYRSPEQVRGAAVSAASDVYSLGVVAYQCLTGAPPFSGDAPVATALAHLERPVAPLPAHVPAAVRSLVTSMLEKDALLRPPSAGAVAEAAAALVDADERAAIPQDPTGEELALASTRLERAPRGRRSPALSRRGRAATAVVTTAALVLTLGLELRSGATPSPVRVPNVRGELESSAQLALLHDRLGKALHVVDVAGAAPHLVVGQRPAAGALAPPGTKVELTVASGYVVLARGALDAKTYSAAVRMLRRKGLRTAELAAATSLGAQSRVVSSRPWGRLREGTVVTLSLTSETAGSQVPATVVATTSVVGAPTTGPDAGAPYDPSAGSARKAPGSEMPAPRAPMPGFASPGNAPPRAAEALAPPPRAKGDATQEKATPPPRGGGVTGAPPAATAGTGGTGPSNTGPRSTAPSDTGSGAGAPSGTGPRSTAPSDTGSGAAAPSDTGSGGTGPGGQADAGPGGAPSASDGSTAGAGGNQAASPNQHPD